MMVMVMIVACSTAPLSAAKPEADQNAITVLDTQSLWRCRISIGTELVRLDSGALATVHPAKYFDRIKVDKRSVNKIRTHERSSIFSLPEAGWRKPDFDDSGWARLQGPFCTGGRYNAPRGKYRSAPLLSIRGKFHVEDPAQTKGLKLSVGYLGGLVVYVNGVELVRGHLPTGEIKPDTPAEDYPAEAFVDDKGMLLNQRIPQKAFADRYRMRRREVRNIAVPAAMLRKGSNVLALELHRAPAPEVFFTGRSRKHSNPPHVKTFTWWSRIGVASVRLTAPKGAPVTANVEAAPLSDDLTVWNHTIVRKIRVTDRPDPNEPLRSVRIYGARNGVFSGQIVAGAAKALHSLSVSCTALSTEDGRSIPASAVDIRYAVADGAPLSRGGPATFDALEGFARNPVPVDQAAGGTIQPIWLAVRVPANAVAGDYQGTITISARGQKPVQTPLHLRVADWTLPDAKRLTTHVGLIQSPDSVAMKYKLKMWSQEHWKRMDGSLDLLGQLGTKVLYIPLIAQTHFGNAHSMVRWIRKDDGTYTHDFSIVERYVDLAVKRLGRIPVVCLYCWEPRSTGAHYDHRRDLGDREIRFSVKDSKTSKLEVVKGPKWGTPACRDFWRPVMAGVRGILAKRGLAKSMMVGLSYDYQPSEGAVADLAAVAPDAPWVIHSHVFWSKLRDRPVGYLVSLWGLHGAGDPEIPALGGVKRIRGWESPEIITYFPRTQLLSKHSLTRFRTYLAYWIVAKGKWGKWGARNRQWSGVDGLGRMGGDFWTVIKDRRGRLKGSVLGYYQRWGGFDMASYAPKALLAPGRDGAIPTVRYEMFRECVQENEARIFIERALIDGRKNGARPGKPLTARAWNLLDERIRALLATARLDSRWFVGSGWQQRSAKLYALAAEVAGK